MPFGQGRSGRVHESGNIKRQRFSTWGLNINHQLWRGGREWICAHTLRFGQVNGTRRFIGMAEARTVLQKFLLLAGCQIGESLWARRTSEGKKAIAINSGETCKSFIQFLTTHALDGVTPKAVHLPD